MKKLTFFLFLLITGVGYAQYKGPITGIKSIDPPEPVLVLSGSPFVNEDFKNGFAIIHGKTGFEAPMRYNAAEDVIEFLDDTGVKKEMLRRPYIKANFDGKVYEILEYSQDGETKVGYFNTMSFGKTKFLYRPKKEIKMETKGYQNQRGEIYARYKDVSDHYIKKEGLPAKKTKLNKRSVLSSFDVKKKKLLEFAIETQGLKLTKEKDVIGLLEYYDSLKKNSSEVQEMQS